MSNTIQLPQHIEDEANLFATHFLQYVKKVPENDPKYEKEYAKAMRKYVDEFINETQIGR